MLKIDDYIESEKNIEKAIKNVVPQKEVSIKKTFISETQLLEAKDPKEKQKLLGTQAEEIDLIKEQNKKGLSELYKELYSLPENLVSKVIQEEGNHLDNLRKLSSAGLIDVPLLLEGKMKLEREAKNPLDNKLAEEFDFLKVLKKLAPTTDKGSDSPDKDLKKAEKVFGRALLPQYSRKRKLFKD